MLTAREAPAKKVLAGGIVPLKPAATDQFMIAKMGYFTRRAVSGFSCQIGLITSTRPMS